MEEIIRKYFQCWLDKDIDIVKEIFSDDVIYSECYGPAYRGIGQIIRWFEDWHQKGIVLQWDVRGRRVLWISSVKSGLQERMIFVRIFRRKL